MELDKWFNEVCLLDQRYCIDPAYSVRDMLDQLGVSIGQAVSVVNFSRLKAGDGIPTPEVPVVAGA